MELKVTTISGNVTRGEEERRGQTGGLAEIIHTTPHYYATENIFIVHSPPRSKN